MPRPGERLAHRFVIRRELGSGAWGTVFLAWDEQLYREVAIKQLKAASVKEPEIAERFIGEARAMATIHHPNIVTVYDLLDPRRADVDQICIVMEYLDGGSLSQVGQGLDVGQVRALGAALCRGLSAAHARGIIHRDLKPDNILFAADSPEPKIGDFGMARIPRDAGGIYSTGIVATHPGNFAHMSPEQAGGKDIDGRSDLFAVGAILYQLLTGRSYLDLDAVRAAALNDQARWLPPSLQRIDAGLARQMAVHAAWCHAIQTASPIPLRRLAPHVPAPLEAAVMRLLALDANQRYPAATAAAEALARAVEPPGPRVEDLLADARKAVERLDMPSAAKTLAEARRRFPAEPEVYALLGKVANLGARAAEARAALEEGIAACPPSAALHRDLGLTLRVLGQREAAARHLERSLQLDPSQRVLLGLIAELRQPETGW